MGAPAAPNAGRSIDALLLEAAGRDPSRPALALGHDELSYVELSTAVDRLAGRMLQAAGGPSGRGDLEGARVCIVCPNVPALVVGMFAAWRLGAVAVPLSARLREHELSGILADAEPSLVLSVETYLGYSFVELLKRLLPRLRTVRACLFISRAGDVDAELPGPAVSTPERIDPRVGGILYTSGTTGMPKGSLLSHEREVGGAAELASILSLTPDDDVAFVIPIPHAFGLTCLLATIAAGACASLVESTFSSKSLGEALEQRRATVLHGSPALFRSLLKTRPGGLHAVRTGFVAGAWSPPELLQELERAGTTVLNLYGLTEAGAVACCRPHDSAHLRHATVGRALPGMELRIDRGGSSTSPTGELQLRGPAVTPGYHRRPEETEQAFVDGWFRTGDLATIENGYLRIAGRLKDVVNVGGFSVFPAEVEAALLDHPDVVQAAVVGVEDERMGEVLHAFVVPRPGSGLTPATLLRFARGNVAGYKLPYVIRMIPELPLLASGKPDRLALAGSEPDARGSSTPRL